MNFALMFALALSLTSTGLEISASGTHSRAGTAHAYHLVHFLLINMSGQPREVHVGDAVIPLPVAQRVAMQMPAGKPMTIMSNTNRGVLRRLAVSEVDEGRLFAID